MSETILVVDDDEVLGQILSRVLAQQGFTVRRAITAAQALQVATQWPPRLALLDLCLPDGDGVELARQLQAANGDLVLLLMTAYPLRLRDDSAGAALFERVLTKPLNLQELRQAVAAALGGTCVPAPAQVAEPVSTGHSLSQREPAASGSKLSD
ncbi:MAG TPA: response regulator [Gemmataceae bacterium]|nr:response regulator [Gemmataceae bacterium]